MRAARPSGSASRSRSATGAVLCDTPSASSESFIGGLLSTSSFSVSSSFSIRLSLEAMMAMYTTISVRKTMYAAAT